ncbi:MAG: cytochrome C [Burkholderiaceae bacterium]
MPSTWFSCPEISPAARLIRNSLFGLGGLWLAAGLAGQARADGPSIAAVSLPPLYRTECAACHMAYAPGLLPAASWQYLLDNLPQHFGTDASLDTAIAAELSKWLQDNAAGFRRVRRESAAPAEGRITRSAWFVREHREVSAEVWRRASVASPANCAACHQAAAQGRFGENEIRIPK